MSFFSEDYLLFFQELAANNHKEWFDANRKRYETSVKEPFKAFTQHLIDELAKKEPVFKDLKASDCIFRINRDIRFSKDKTPYKTMCSAVISPQGKKSSSIHGIYFELGPEHLRAYGGVYEIAKEELAALREGIADNLDEFKQLYTSTDFTKLYGYIQVKRTKKSIKICRAQQQLNLYSTINSSTFTLHLKPKTF